MTSTSFSQAALAGPGVNSSNDIAVYVGTLAGGFHLLFREGDPVPGLPGVVYSFGLLDTRLGPGGQVFARASFTPAAAGPALMLGAPGSFAIIARAGDPAPGRPGETFTAFTERSTAINRNGVVAFVAATSGGGRGLWSGTPGSLALRVFQGDPAPGTASTFSVVQFASLDEGGGLAVLSHLQNGGSAVYSGIPGSTRLVEQAIGTGYFYSPTVNAFGRVAFLAGPEWANKIVAELSTTPGLLTVLAEENIQAPGLPGGIVFDDFGIQPVINRFKQLAFSATLKGPGVGSANNDSVWIHDPEHGTQMVAREGSAIRIAPADVRTIASLTANISNLQGVSLQDGSGEVLTDQGEVAFLATFTDAAAAILVTPPRPQAVVFFTGFESGPP